MTIDREGANYLPRTNLSNLVTHPAGHAYYKSICCL
jgi:hypothetical protein